METERDITTATYDWAVRLQAWGAQSAVPIVRGAKRVAVAWTPYQTRQADASELYDWFITEDYGLGILLGPMLVQVDFDTDDPDGGFSRFVAEYPAFRTLPRVRTGSGRMHCFFRTPVPIRKFNLAYGGGVIEFRSGNHIAVMPPTLHPNGQPYQWEVEPAQGFPVLDIARLGIAPPERPLRALDISFSEGEPLSEGETAAIIAAITPFWDDGTRHAMGLAVAGWLAGHGVPEDSARAVIETLSQGRGDDARGRQDRIRGVRDTYERIRSGEPVSGWSMLTSSTSPLIDPDTARTLDTIMRHRPALPGIEDEDDSVLRRIPLRDLLATEFPPRRWVVEGLATIPSLVGVFGRGKTFKSLNVIELAVSVAAGDRMYGELATGQPRPVLYVQMEAPDPDLKNTFLGIIAAHGFSPEAVADSIHLVSNCPWKIDNPEMYHWLEEQIEATGAEVVIIDPLVEVHDQDENTKDMMRVLQPLKRLRNEHNLCVIFVHHNNKNPEYKSPEDSIRGYSGIWAAVDGGIFHLQEDTEAEAKIKVRLKFGGMVEPFLLRPDFSEPGRIALERAPLGEKGVKRLSDTQIITFLEDNPGWYDVRQLEHQLNYSVRTIQPRANRLAAEGKIRKREEGPARKATYSGHTTTDLHF